jgi:carboxyl-terminal processing protease
VLGASTVVARCLTALVLLVVGLPVRASISAQAIGGIERGRGRYMLGTVRDRLEKNYYDSTFHGLDLRATAARADSLIRTAQSNGEIFRIITAFVRGLDDSHTNFYPPRRAADFEYGWDFQMIGDSCFVTRVEPGSDAATKGLLVGDRVIAVDRYLPSRRYFSLLQQSLYMVNPRPVVRLEVEAADGSLRTMDVRAKVTERPHVTDWLTLIRERELADRPPFAEVAALPNDVLILRLGWFGDRSHMDRAMGHARDVGTLILDLRGNGGGLEEGLIRLVGHVFEKPMPIATVRGRRDTRRLESKPVRHPFGGLLFVLIDSRSSSSSEAFAYLVQLHGRGVVVGDRSAGAVMRSRFHDLFTGEKVVTLYGLSITEAEVIMPDGTRLEGRGVPPDMRVLPTATDLATGRDPVLAKALTMAGHPTDAALAGTLLPRR